MSLFFDLFTFHNCYLYLKTVLLVSHKLIYLCKRRTGGGKGSSNEFKEALLAVSLNECFTIISVVLKDPPSRFRSVALIIFIYSGLIKFLSPLCLSPVGRRRQQLPPCRRCRICRRATVLDRCTGASETHGQCWANMQRLKYVKLSRDSIV